ncbi:MAG: hypothetical protein P4L85_18615, partial [Paludisphaera borealis]|uniref:hypothetical protein n=1 Tax=Paludisphaera borealis TaxID=1387353 RepID=UPI002847C950
RGVETLPPAVVASPASRLDEIPRKELEEGKSLSPTKFVSQGYELVTRACGGRLNHGDLLDEVTGGVEVPPRYRPRRSLYSLTTSLGSIPSPLEAYVILAPFAPDPFAAPLPL